MTSNLEQLKKDFVKEYCNDHNVRIRFLRGKFEDDAEIIETLFENIDKAFALGTLNGLDKVIELLPEEKKISKPDLQDESNLSVARRWQDEAFNSCRSQILSKIKEERSKYGN